MEFVSSFWFLSHEFCVNEYFLNGMDYFNFIVNIIPLPPILRSMINNFTQFVCIRLHLLTWTTVTTHCYCALHATRYRWESDLSECELWLSEKKTITTEFYKRISIWITKSFIPFHASIPLKSSVSLSNAGNKRTFAVPHTTLTHTHTTHHCNVMDGQHSILFVLLVTFSFLLTKRIMS